MPTVLLNANVLCMDHHRDSLTASTSPHSLAIKYAESGATVIAEDPKLFSELAPTLAIMKMFLKEKFKPLQVGLSDNVVAFFGSSEFTPPHNCFHAEEQEIILDEELTNILCQLILLEQKEASKGNVTF